MPTEPTPYHVLKQTGPTTFELVTKGLDKPVKARTPKQAVKGATKGQSAEVRNGTFFTPPARSFQPLHRNVQQTEIDVFSDTPPAPDEPK